MAGLIDFPSPVDWFESAKSAGLERQEAVTVLSAVYSFWITAMWSLGQKKWFWFLADAASAMYQTLAQLQKNGKLDLTVPTEMLEPKNLSRFTTTSPTVSK